MNGWQQLFHEINHPTWKNGWLEKNHPKDPAKEASAFERIAGHNSKWSFEKNVLPLQKFDALNRFS